MKPIITILTLLCFSFFANAQVQPDFRGWVHPKITVTGGTNKSSAFNLTGYRGADTFVVTQNTSSWYLGQDSGLSWDRPLVIINASTKKIKVTGGIKAENCQYVKVIGWGSDSLYGFEFRGGGVTCDYSGMMKGILIEGCYFTGGSQGGAWLKMEVGHACDFYNYWNSQPEPGKSMYGNINSYLAVGNKPFDTVWFLHNRVDSCGGEALYFMTTDYILPATGQWRDALPCLGNPRPAPMQGKNCRADSNEISFTGRTAIQMNQMTAGTNTMNGNYMHNIGYEYAVTHDPSAKSQGGGGRVGWQWQQKAGKTMEVAYNIIDTTFIYMLDIEEASNVHHNWCRNIGFVKYNGVITTNPDALPGTIFYANNPAICPQHIDYNTVLSSTASQGIKYAVYGSNNYQTTGNTACNNNVAINVLSPTFNYTTDCGVIPPPDTTYKDSTYTIVHDSLVRGTIPQRIDSSVQRVLRSHVLLRDKFKQGVYIEVYRDSYVDSTIYDTTAAHDTIYICKLCTPPHDTTVRVPVIRRNVYGVLIPTNDSLTTQAQKLHQAKIIGVTAYRSAWNYGDAYRNKQVVDSGFLSALTVNTQDVGTGPHSFPVVNPQTIKTFDSVLTISPPTWVFWLNEPPHTPYWTGTATEYMTGFVQMIPTAHAHNVLIGDGGELFPIIYPMAAYYNSIGRSDSVTWLSTQTGITTNNLLNSAGATTANNWYNSFFPQYKASQADFFCLHYYVPEIVADSNNTVVSQILPVMIGFIIRQTGKPVITNETGTRNYSTVLFNAFFTQWVQAGVGLIGYYNGLGTYAKPLEQTFKTFITNNP